MTAILDLSFLMGILLAALIALASYRLGALSASGAAGAGLIGALTFGIGGWRPTLLLLLFFITSSALSRLRERLAGDESESFAAKGGRRDLGQVMANGLPAAGGAVLYGLTGATIWLAATAGALAAATADTWATEIGAWSPSTPRLITTWEQVPAGSSGGVTFLGTAGALAGAVLIGAAGAASLPDWRMLLPVGLGGFAGALLDSVLGATVQVNYRCPRCDLQTEQHPQHRCGAPTAYARGWRWMNNDAVNFAATALGALVAAAWASGAGLM